MKTLLRGVLLLVGTTMLLEAYSNVGKADVYSEATMTDREYETLKDRARMRYLNVKDKYSGRSPAVLPRNTRNQQ